MLSSFSFSNYTYSNPKKYLAHPKKGKDKSSDRDDLLSLVCPSFKNINLIEALKGKRLSKKHKQSLCLVWFVHNVLWARDVNNNILLDLIKLAEDLKAFNSYPWGYESFKTTVKYLLTSLMPRTVNLYGFPWAFMVDVTVEATAKQHNITVDNPSTASMGEEKVVPCHFGRTEELPFEGFNISYEAPKKLTKLINDYSKWIFNGLSKHHFGRNCGLFIAAYAEYLSDGLQVPNDGLDIRLLHKRYDALL
ncbi:hypothetical protein BC332_26059 [Capsicum chinense]|nr:hypothetical protein BC332_26059 [Capsicum chinense]